jgi:hypothetical protein
MSKTTSLFKVDHEEGVPYSDSPVFQVQNPKKLDPTKPTAAIITWGNYKLEYNHIHGFVQEVANSLEDTHNIIYIGKEDAKTVRHLDNFFLFTLKEYHKINGTRFLRKKECEGTDIDNVVHNHAELVKEFELAFSNVKFDKVIFGNSCFYELPLTGYFKEYKHLVNEFHDYVGTDEEEIENRNNCALKIANNYNQRVSVLAFSMFHKNIFANLCIWLNENHPVKMNYSFVLDPVCFHKVFEVHNLPFKYFYFNDDKRGTRNLQEFPISHLQHVINEERVFKSKDHIVNKDKKFFWMGSMIHERGIRSSLWDTFFEDLNVENSTIWAPIRTNGIYFNEKQVTSKFGKNSKEKALARFPELVEKIQTHPMYDGHLLPAEVSEKIARYKYTFILRCVSIEDSLNYRPVHYTHLRILPFIDSKYDPSYIQIPKEIQDLLVVNSAEDIEERINYFEMRPKEREAILDKLHKHFKIDEFKENWKEITQSYFE